MIPPLCFYVFLPKHHELCDGSGPVEGGMNRGLRGNIHLSFIQFLPGAFHGIAPEESFDVSRQFRDGFLNFVGTNASSLENLPPVLGTSLSRVIAWRRIFVQWLP